MTNVIINVKCTSSTELYWRKSGTSSWDQLTDTTSSAPSIDESSSSRVTYEFLKDSSSTYDILYKATPGSTPVAVPTSNGPTNVVSPGNGTYVYFGRSEPNPTYYIGYVKVSDDDDFG